MVPVPPPPRTVSDGGHRNQSKLVEVGLLVPELPNFTFSVISEANVAAHCSTESSSSSSSLLLPSLELSDTKGYEP